MEKAQRGAELFVFGLAKGHSGGFHRCAVDRHHRRGFDKSDAILNLINDGYLLCTMAQNPDVMGYEA